MSQTQQPRALGRLPARKDTRVPRFSVIAQHLPLPPPVANWYAAVGSWPLLMNDQYGDCVEAAIGHAIQAFTTYTSLGQNSLPMTNDEVVRAYSAITEFDPNDPSTDNGTYVMGHGGAIEYWHNVGIMCGGTLNKLDVGLSIAPTNTAQWRQGISLFGGAMLGINFPQKLLNMDVLPFVWKDGSGPYAGGHEIWVCGFETLPSGEILYDIVSWGQMYRCTSDFLLQCTEEVVVLLDRAFCNAQNINPAGISFSQLAAYMQRLGSAQA